MERRFAGWLGVMLLRSGETSSSFPHLPLHFARLICNGRYLTAVDAKYYDGLSEASKQSLKFQGGPFEGDELESFEKDPLRDEMVELRKWDDRAKIVGIEDETPRAGSYQRMIESHLEANRASQGLS